MTSVLLLNIFYEVHSKEKMKVCSIINERETLEEDAPICE